MSTYSDLRGLKIKYLSSDTSGDRITEGELFYNSTTGALKGYLGLAAFHGGGSVATVRTQTAGSTGGTQSANFIVGGEIPSDSSLSNECEEYNGTGYSIGGDLSTARRKFAGSGTLTAGLVFGGAEQPNSVETETYDGSSFSEVNNMGTARAQHGGVGTQTAALACGGYDTARTGKTEEYDGTNWSEQNDMSLARSQLNSTVGTQTAAVVMGGNTTPGVSGYSAFAEEYDGTSWTTSSSTLPIGKNGAFGFGTLTAAVITGGEIAGGSKSTTTQMYDGTSFSSSPAAPATGRMSGTAAGTSASGIIQAGSPGAATEEFTISLTATTAAAWASGGNYPTNNYGLQGAGSQTAALAWGGDAAGATTNVTAEYNGSSWTTSGNYPFNGWRIGGDGTQTAAIGSGGVNNSADFQPSTNTYDGSSWTNSGNNLPANRRSHAMVGTQTSALVFAGSPTTTTLEYNGSSYSSAPALATPRAGMHALGTQTAALCGATPPNSASEEYNGSSWSTGGSQVKATGSSAEGNGTGTQTAGMFVGGYPSQATTQLYDGTIFTTAPNLGSAGYGLGQSSSSSTAALAFGGYRGGYSNSTEEFTGESTATQAIKTVDFD